jgi:predicted ArsR family transcriptional regulator
MLYDIDEPVRAFIREHVGSVTELEVLLTLLRTAPQEWTAAEVAVELRITVGWAQGHLAKLSASRILVERAGTRPMYLYEASSPALNQILALLNMLYAQHRNAVIDLIYSTPNDGIRTFADAFKLRKEP